MSYFRDTVVASVLLYCVLLMLNVASHQFVSALLPLPLYAWLNVLLIAIYLLLHESKRWTRG